MQPAFSELSSETGLLPWLSQHSLSSADCMDVSSAAIRNQRGRTHTRTAYPAGAATSSVPAHHSTFYVPVSAGRNDINMESGAPPFDAGDALAEPSAAVRGSSHANASNGADDNRRLAGCRAAPLPMVDASREASQALGCHNLPGVIATGPLPAAATASPGLLARSAGCGPARPDSATAGGQRSQRQAPRLGATPMASAAQSRPASAQSIAVVPAAPSRPQSGARLPGSSQLPPLPGRWAGATVSPRPPQPEQQHQLQQLQQQPVQLQALRTPRGIATVRAAASLTAPRAPSPRLAAAFSADNDASEGQAGPYSTCPGAGSAGGDVEAPSPPEPPPCAKPAPEGTECRICLSAECPEDLVAPCACAGAAAAGRAVSYPLHPPTILSVRYWPLMIDARLRCPHPAP